MNHTRPTICVFAASSDALGTTYVSAARALGEGLARRGWACVHGAGSTGLMRALSDGALDAGGEVTGVIPKFMVENGWCHDRLEQVIVTADMHDRKRQLADMSDAVIALPGGCGTLEEVLEAITWRQLGIAVKPIVLLSTGGFYAPLADMLNRCVEQGFMRQSHRTLWTVAETPEQALDIIERELSCGPACVDPKLPCP